MKAGKIENRAAIYRAAIANLESRHPELNGVKFLASRLNHSPNLVYAWCEGQSAPSVVDEEMIFLLCDFPQGFAHKCRFVFNLTQEEAQ